MLSVPLELVTSLWPLRLDMARVAVAQRGSAIALRTCRSFETLMGYADQVAQPEVERLCHATVNSRTTARESNGPGRAGAV